MTGLMLKPLWVDEFTAGYLEDLLFAELETLKAHLHEHRDNANGLGWARVKLHANGVHSVWDQLREARRIFGESTSESIENFEDAAIRLSKSMPRSKANAVQWEKARAADKVERARMLKVLRGRGVKRK